MISYNMTIIRLSTLDSEQLNTIHTLQAKYYQYLELSTKEKTYEHYHMLYPHILRDVQLHYELFKNKEVVKYMWDNRGLHDAWLLLSDMAISAHLSLHAKDCPYFNFIPVHYEHKWLKDIARYNSIRGVYSLFEMIPNAPVDLLDVLKEFYYLNHNNSYAYTSAERFKKLAHERSEFLLNTMIWDVISCTDVSTAQDVERILLQSVIDNETLVHQEVDLHFATGL